MPIASNEAVLGVKWTRCPLCRWKVSARTAAAVVDGLEDHLAVVHGIPQDDEPADRHDPTTTTV